MTDTILTHQEVAELALAADAQSRDQRFAFASFARTVEAAVCAKLIGVPIDARITEYSARRRERAAWDAGALWGTPYINANALNEIRMEGDRRYPLTTCDKCGQALP